MEEALTPGLRPTTWEFVRISGGALTGLPRAAKAHLRSRPTPGTQARAANDERRTKNDERRPAVAFGGGARTLFPPEKRRKRGAGPSAHARRLNPALLGSSPDAGAQQGESALESRRLPATGRLRMRRAALAHAQPSGACARPSAESLKAGGTIADGGRGRRLRALRWGLIRVTKLQRNRPKQGRAGLRISLFIPTY